MRNLNLTYRRRLFCGIALVIFVWAPVVAGREMPVSQAAPRNYEKLKPPSVPFIPGPVIPGLRQNAVPQGIAFSAKRNRLLISHYFDDAASCVSVLDYDSGKLRSVVSLADPSGRPLRGHVGGIAVISKSLFAASGGYIYQYRIGGFLKPDPGSLAKPVAARKCETKASFCTATKDMLFVGEFSYGKKYPTHPSHHLRDRKGTRRTAWVCGYERADLMGKPKCVLSIRQKVQGMCISGNRVFLSASYGRGNRSRIYVYKNPIGGAAHKTVSLSGGGKVPLWFLDGENYIGKIDFPPMAEGIVMIGDRLAVLSESGAAKYQSKGKGPLDRVLLLDVSKFQSE